MAFTEKQSNILAAVLGVAALTYVGFNINFSPNDQSLPNAPGTPVDIMNLAFSNYYKGSDQPQFNQAVNDMAVRLGVNPNWLMYIMWNETAHTFSPTIQPTSGPFNPGYATGLIQFEPDTAADLGTSTSALAQMSAIEQLPFVEKFFSNNNKTYGAPQDLYNAYLAVLYPAAQNEPDTFQFPQWMVSANPEFFSTGNTKADFKQGLYKNIPSQYRTQLGIA